MIRLPAGPRPGSFLVAWAYRLALPPLVEGPAYRVSRVSPLRGSVSVSHAQASLQAGTHRVSQVPDASLHASHALKWTPAEPRAAHQKKRCLCIGFWGVNPIAICIKRFTRLSQALGSADSLAGYVVPCVRFTCVVRLYIAASSTVATLGMSGWLNLPQPALAPGKKPQAWVGALTLPVTASCPTATFHVHSEPQQGPRHPGAG